MEFRLTGVGWAECELRLGERAFTLTGISYLTDALGDLVRLALMIATGAPSAAASFNREPYEWRIVATSLLDHAVRTGAVSIAIFSFPDAFTNAPLSEGDLDFVGDCDALAFSKAVLVGAKQAIESHGMKGWEGYPLPTEALRALEAALGED